MIDEKSRKKQTETDEKPVNICGISAQGANSVKTSQKYFSILYIFLSNNFSVSGYK